MEPDKIRLHFEEINPYVRYASLNEFPGKFKSNNIKAYDHRFFYICKGSGTMELNGRTHAVEPGDAVFIPSGICYTILPSAGQTLLVIGINFDFTHKNACISQPIYPENAKNFKEENIIEHVFFADAGEFNAPLCLKKLESFEGRLMEICHEYSEYKKFWRPKINGIFASLLADIARMVISAGSSSSEDDKRSDTSVADRIISYIRENYFRNLTNEKIAAKFNYHPNYLNKVMVKNTGLSMHQYLMKIRLSHSIRLLRTSQAPVSEIAISVGFSDPNYFSKFFKQNMGRSPSSFRKKSGGTV